jgi:hypothetical protein
MMEVLLLGLWTPSMAAGMPTTTRGTTRKPVKMAKFILRGKQEK